MLSVKYNELSPQDIDNYLKKHYYLKRDDVISQVVVKGTEKNQKKS